MAVTILTPGRRAYDGPIWLPASCFGYRPSGQIEITFEHGDPTIHIDLVECVHCRRDFKVSRGSGKRRGFCPRCVGPTCGSKHCPSHDQRKIIRREIRRS